jgi:hypothetical protein
MTGTILTTFQTLTPGAIVTVRLSPHFMTGGRGAVDNPYRFKEIDALGAAVFTRPAGSGYGSILATRDAATGVYDDYVHEADVTVVVSEDGAGDEPEVALSTAGRLSSSLLAVRSRRRGSLSAAWRPCCTSVHAPGRAR